MVVPSGGGCTDGGLHVVEGSVEGPLGDWVWHIGPAIDDSVVHGALDLID